MIFVILISNFPLMLNDQGKSLIIWLRKEGEHYHDRLATPGFYRTVAH